MTVPRAYYNENNPGAAAWLRQLIADGHIAPGDVDERSIAEVESTDLAGYVQCHFFAGIGGWSYALRLACWPDERPVWTGSCPCQPFSAAGKRKGFADSRHLWPELFRLIRECHPDAILGEQVASQLGWLDLVSGNLEAEGYAVGSVIVGAHSVGAPHIRQRLYWVADLAGTRLEKAGSGYSGARSGDLLAPECGRTDGVADAQRGSAERRRHNMESAAGDAQGEAPEREWVRDDLGDGKPVGGVADMSSERRGETRPDCGRSPQRASGGSEIGGLGHGCGDRGAARLPKPGSRQKGLAGIIDNAGGQCAGNAPWRDLEWLPCRDGKSRPTQPGLSPLVDGLPRGVVPNGNPGVSEADATAEARVMRLTGYGNAIVPQLAAAFIQATGLLTAAPNDVALE